MHVTLQYMAICTTIHHTHYSYNDINKCDLLIELDLVKDLFPADVKFVIKAVRFG